jgi:hypothetical protein
MMRIDEQDIQSLLAGQPPAQKDLLLQMTLGREHWLDHLRHHYLANYIAAGGSKVKILAGGAGTGKTHLLRCLLQDAADLNYIPVYLSARDYRLNDLTYLYRLIVKQINKSEVVQGICCRVAAQLGYPDHDGTTSLLPLLCQDQGLTRDLAIQEIKRGSALVFKAADLGPSFLAFVHSVVDYRLIQDNEEGIRLALRWLVGDKLERYQKKATLLFERLQKTNARYWLNSLIRLLRLAGFTGLVVAIDDLEVMTERSPETRRFRYTPNAIKDICELFRQLIDDVELLEHFLLVLAGGRDMIEDERRGFKSYEALWMRLQTGLIPTDRFNPLADIVDVDRHLAAHGKGFPDHVQNHLRHLLQLAGFSFYSHDLPDLSEFSQLRARIIATVLMTMEAG